MSSQKTKLLLTFQASKVINFLYSTLIEIHTITLTLLSKLNATLFLFQILVVFLEELLQELLLAALLLLFYWD